MGRRRVRIDSSRGVRFPNRCACCGNPKARQRTKIYVTSGEALGGSAVGLVVTAAITAAMGGGTVGTHNAVIDTLQAPCCPRCRWHCGVHEFALIAAAGGGLLGGIALFIAQSELSENKQFNRASFLLFFLLGAVLGAALTYFVCTFVFAFPSSDCPSRWPPVWCAEVGPNTLEFSFSSYAYAGLFEQGYREEWGPGAAPSTRPTTSGGPPS